MKPLQLLTIALLCSCSDATQDGSPNALSTTGDPTTASSTGGTTTASSTTASTIGGTTAASSTSGGGTAAVSQGGTAPQVTTSAGGASVGGAPPSSGGLGGSSGGMNTSGGAGGTDVMANGGAATVSGSGGSAGGTTADCAAGSLLCDGFEDYSPGDSPGGAWSASARGSGAIVVDTERAFSGNQSLHVSGQLNADHANITTPIQDSSVVYVRFMMYTASYPASSGVHTRLARLGLSTAANGAPYSAYALSTYNGTAIEKVNSIYLRDTGTHMDDANLTNDWVCWEFSIDKTGGEGNVEVHLWVDGRDLPLSPAGSSSHGMTSASWDPITFEMFMLGLDGFQNDSQRADFWIDDLLVTPERVGCPSTQ